MPCPFTSESTTDCARRSESSWLTCGEPTVSVCPTTRSLIEGSPFSSLTISARAGFDSGFTSAFPVSKKSP